MRQIVRSFVLAAAGGLLLAACSLPLPAPIELEGGVFGLDGVPVVLTADVPTGSLDTSLVLTFPAFAGTFAEDFTVDPSDIPSALQNLFNIASVEEAVGLDIALTVQTSSALPPAFTVAEASLTDVIVKKGTTTLFAGAFQSIEGAEMAFTQGLCADDVCQYTSSATIALVDIGLSGNTADKLAKAITAGGDFSVSGKFAVTVDPGLPEDAIVNVVLVSLGAVLE